MAVVVDWVNAFSAILRFAERLARAGIFRIHSIRAHARTATTSNPSPNIMWRVDLYSQLPTPLATHRICHGCLCRSNDPITRAISSDVFCWRAHANHADDYAHLETLWHASEKTATATHRQNYTPCGNLHGVRVLMCLWALCGGGDGGG